MKETLDQNKYSQGDKILFFDRRITVICERFDLDIPEEKEIIVKGIILAKNDSNYEVHPIYEKPDNIYESWLNHNCLVDDNDIIKRVEV